MDRKEQPGLLDKRVSWLVFASIGLVSALYFADVFLRASAKCFWVDELVTVYLCRLPNLHSTLVAVQHGADLNPPLFYALTRGAQYLFGDGLIATRLPAIAGFYLFCLCLYLFVSRTMGRLAGFVAGVFPFFTMALYYASEARPHAITLGWCGLALVCWQRSKAGARRYFFLVAFCLSLTGALLTHVYATFILLPFFFAELYEAYHTRRIDWGPAVAIGLAVIAAVPAYVPLLRSYSNGGPQHLPLLSIGVLQPFLLSLFGRSVIVLLTALILVGVAATKGENAEAPRRDVPPRELILALCFAITPILGILSLKLTHGPFFFRYFLSSIAGFSIFLGAANTIVTRRYPRASMWLPALMLLLIVQELRTTTQIRIHHLGTVEPTSGFTIGSPEEPLARDTALSSMKSNEDVLVLQELNGPYLANYAPPSLASHIYIGEPTEEGATVTTFALMKKWTHVKLNVTAFAPFFATHNHFFAYGSSTGTFSPACGNCEQEFLNAGYTLKSVQRDVDGVLYEYSK